MFHIDKLDELVEVTRVYTISTLSGVFGVSSPIQHLGTEYKCCAVAIDDNNVYLYGSNKKGTNIHLVQTIPNKEICAVNYLNLDDFNGLLAEYWKSDDLLKIKEINRIINL